MGAILNHIHRRSIMPRAVLILIISLFAPALELPAAEPAPPAKRVISDPEKAKADPDFLIQGEYSGAVKIDGKDEKLGVQVFVTGRGAFKAVGYRGGLPGDGFEPGGGGKKRVEWSGKAENGAAAFPELRVGGFEGAARADGKFLTLKTGSGAEAGRLEKVERKSPTLGARPPAGAVVLFDPPVNEFKGKGLEGELLREGELSTPKFQGCTLHVEFRTPYMPDDGGQGRGNSGVYLQSRYEVQVLDSFGLEGKMDECGGIYTVAPPRVNMCFPPIAWQTYDIDFAAARFDAAGKKVKDATLTVRHNGVLVHDGVKVDHTTTAAPERDESPKPGPIHLQDHGSPVRYRNVWLVPRD
jgi:3-keto-disaccharide hydrolase